METTNKPVSELLKDMYLTLNPDVQNASDVQQEADELDSEQPDAQLEEAVSVAESILSAYDLEIVAEDLDEYLEGLQQVLESGELDEDGFKELEEVWKQIGRAARTGAEVVKGVKKTGKKMTRGFLKGYLKGRLGTLPYDTELAAKAYRKLGGDTKKLGKELRPNTDILKLQKTRQQALRQRMATSASRALKKPQKVAGARARSEEIENTQVDLSEEFKNIFESTEALLESVGFEIEADNFEEYLEGIQQILENEELSEGQRSQLEQFFKKLGKFVRTAKHVITAPVRAAQKTAEYVGQKTGEFKAGWAEKDAELKAPKPPKAAKVAPPPKVKKPGMLATAFKRGMEKGMGKQPTAAQVEPAAAAQTAKAVAQAKPVAPPARKGTPGTAQAQQVSPQAKAAKGIKAKMVKKPQAAKRLPVAAKGMLAGMRPNVGSAALAGFRSGQKKAAGEAVELWNGTYTGICEDRRRWIEKALETPIAPELVVEEK